MIQFLLESSFVDTLSCQKQIAMAEWPNGYGSM